MDVCRLCPLRSAAPLPFLAGRTSLLPRAVFDDVAFPADEKIGRKINWDLGTQDDPHAGIDYR